MRKKGGEDRAVGKPCTGTSRSRSSSPSATGVSLALRPGWVAPGLQGGITLFNEKPGGRFRGPTRPHHTSITHHAETRHDRNKMANPTRTSSAGPSFLQSRIVTAALTGCLALLIYFNNDSAADIGGTSGGIDSPENDRAPSDGTANIDIHVCSEEGIAILTSALHANPETCGLRPYWAGKEGKENDVDMSSHQSPSIYTYPGLDDNLLDSSFRGKQVYFFGDSTLYYLDQWVYRLLATSNRTLVDGSLSSMDMTAANEAVDNASPEITFYTITYGESKTYVSGTFTVGAVGPGGTCDLSRKYAKMKAKCSRVSGGCHTVIANFGFHWLHFHGAGRTLSGCEAVKWIHYEQWMQHMVQLAREVGAKILLFKTLNFICSEKYTDEYAEAHAMYSTKDSNVHLINQCFQDLRDQIPADIIGDADVRNYCYNATFNERGSTHLNQRMEVFVKENRVRMKEKLGIEIGLYNDHDIERCAYTNTSDGRHYHSLNLVRIRLLGHLLWCMAGGRVQQ